ncbi:MAG TPA: preprotein translocase subunit SecE [Anaerolineae bacterium]|nr:preprotein translocase subunit SecE [Anaerolineae bacterium]
MADVKPDNRVVHYFKETRAELKKVNWPTRKEAQNLTVIVLVVTFVMAAVLFIFDQLSAGLLKGVLVQPRDTASIVITLVLAVIGLVALVIALRRQ